MRVRTLIAATDEAYTNHISHFIAERYADTIDVSVCNTSEQLRKALTARRYDVALMDDELINQGDLQCIDLPLLLWTDATGSDIPAKAKLIKKHMRISKTIADILEQFAAIKGNLPILGEPTGTITAVWSPCGGIGTTTVALAYAQSKVKPGKEVFYLNMESFASTPAYFGRQGKSISTVFEMLENSGGDGGSSSNIALLIQGIRCTENGISYLSAPNNFDDINILSDGDIRELVSCCSQVSDELVIDLSCICNSHTRQIFELADKVLLVTDSAAITKAKQEQFFAQSNVFESIKDKLVLVINRVVGELSKMTDTVNGVESDSMQSSSILLPFIDSTDAQYIYKTLSKSNFGE